MKKQRRPKTPNISNEEWNFSKCPKDQLRYCWYYEYAREIESIRMDYPELRERAESASQSLDDEEPYIDESGNLNFVYWTYPLLDPQGDGIWIQLPHGFPDLPYLKTNHQKTDLRELPKPKSFATDNSDDGEAVGAFPEYRKHKVLIDWSRPNTAIVKDFNSWLKDNRSKNRRDPRSKQGKLIAPDYKTDLKALGIYRITKKCDTQEEAIYYYNKQNKSHVLQPEFSKLIKRAAFVIVKFGGFSDHPIGDVLAKHILETLEYEQYEHFGNLNDY